MMACALHRGQLRFTIAHPVICLTMSVILPAVVPAPAEFGALFSDASKDPTNNNPQTLLNPFIHNLNDDTNNVSTEHIRDRLVAAGHRWYEIVAIIISQVQAYHYLLPHCWCWEHALTGLEPDLDGKFFSFDGELVENQGHIGELDAGVFCLLNNQVLVAMVGQIFATINFRDGIYGPVQCRRWKY